MKSKLSKLLFKVNTVIIRGLMLLTVIVVVLTSLAGEANASSRYYCSTPTITLEVKPQTISLNPPESGDKPDTAVFDDNNPDHRDNTNGGDTAVSEDEENDEADKADQQSGQKDNTGDSTEAGEGEAVAIHHNALIISRLIPEDHSLHTEINVDNITSSDQIFFDVFSGDQEAGTEADSVFISFENENGTVQTVRIGLDEQIDNITVLDAVTETRQTVSSSDENHHIDDFLGLEQIRSPLIVIIPDTNERIYFIDSKALLDHVFQEQYRIESVRAIRDEMEIRLIKK